VSPYISALSPELGEFGDRGFAELIEAAPDEAEFFGEFRCEFGFGDRVSVTLTPSCSPVVVSIY
jgi:hypothetical protein